MSVRAEVLRGPLDDAGAKAEVSRPSNGAVLIFYGEVRDRHEGRRVDRIEYHAYAEMAQSEIAAAARAAAEKHGCDVVVLHRLGEVAVGEASLVVAVGAPHRREAFACGLEIVDEVKRRAPIFKREFGSGGALWQEGALPPEPGAGQ